MTVERHQPGRGSALTPADRITIQEMHVIEQLSISEIARQLGRDRGTISNVVKADDTLAMRRQYEMDQTAEARRVLQRNAARVAGNWVAAAEKGAERGDHRPSKDLLLHTGVIEPLTDQAPRVAVQINLNGGPEPASLLAARGVVSVGGDDGGLRQENERNGAPLPGPIAPRNFCPEKGSPSVDGSSCGNESENEPGAVA